MARTLPRSRTLPRTPGEAAAPATFLALSLVEATVPGGWDRHRHAEHEAIIAGRGAYRGMLNGEAMALAPGEVLVAKPGDWHEDVLAPGTAYHALWFHLPGGLFAAGTVPAQQVARPGAALAAPLAGLERLVLAGARPARLDAALAAVLGALLDALPPVALAPPFAAASGFAARLHAVFSRLPAGPASADELAREAGLARRTLERQCRAELGCGPAEAYVRWRLRRAGELLRTTDRPVRAISEELGFANPFHFSRAFARVHGAPPAAWRGGSGQ